MLCDNCKKNPSTVHLKGITNGMKAELHLCQECSNGMANIVNMEMPFNLENILGNLGGADSPISLENIFKGILDSVQSMGQGPQLPNAQINSQFKQILRNIPGPCGVCGLSYDQFKTTGKLGCEGCYQSFPKEIVALFKNVQNSSRHEGKYPKRSGAQILQRREVDKLRTNLQQAVDEENYEEAARIRDQIRSLEVSS
ncbi:MAG: UvrB/UvrC motif-containing protein [Defluviitaleaceae bacterium]|nr:UvrB/UvrC motif-containing protein [Defluviitaleaceae bacterium]